MQRFASFGFRAATALAGGYAISQTNFFPKHAFSAHASAASPDDHAALAAKAAANPGVCPVDHVALAAKAAANPGVCPVDHVALAAQASADHAALVAKATANPGVCPVDHVALAAKAAANPGVCPVDHVALAAKAAANPGVCPVDHVALAAKAAANPGVCPVKHDADAAKPTPSAPVCPVKHDAAAGSGVCPVNPMLGSHGSPSLDGFIGKKYLGANKNAIDDDSDRYVNPNDASYEAIEDDFDLDKIEHKDFVPGALIPATGRGNSADGAHWANPSPQQLFLALRRKDKPIQESDVFMVALIHSEVTQYTWNMIQEFEDLHKSECPNPSLKRFEGNYGKMSPKSFLGEKILGAELFDRHDWYVDRCGKEVHYIIDYYDSNDGDSDEVGYIMDVRPDLSTYENIQDRIKMTWKRYQKGEPLY